MNSDLIARESWPEFFDFVTEQTQGYHLELEVAGLDIGDQIDEQWVHILGVSYDPESEILCVHMDNFDYPIRRPEEVACQMEGLSIQWIGCKDAADHVEVLRFRAPLKLPPVTF